MLKPLKLHLSVYNLQTDDFVAFKLILYLWNIEQKYGTLLLYQPIVPIKVYKFNDKRVLFIYSRYNNLLIICYSMRMNYAYELSRELGDLHPKLFPLKMGRIKIYICEILGILTSYFSMLSGNTNNCPMQK